MTLVKEIAMQIAAASPAYASRAATVPADVLEKEKAIYRAQMEDSGKPANVIDKIVEGKLGSFYAQVVLTDQPSIRDPKMTVADVLAAANKALGAPITVTRFARLKVGEAALSDRVPSQVVWHVAIAPVTDACTAACADYNLRFVTPPSPLPPTNASSSNSPAKP